MIDVYLNYKGKQKFEDVHLTILPEYSLKIVKYVIVGQTSGLDVYLNNQSMDVHLK